MKLARTLLFIGLIFSILALLEITPLPITVSIIFGIGKVKAIIILSCIALIAFVFFFIRYSYSPTYLIKDKERGVEYGIGKAVIRGKPTVVKYIRFFNPEEEDEDE